MTKERAVLHFQDRVQQIQKEQGRDLISAWAMARALLPGLFAKAFPGNDPALPPKVRQVGSYRDSAEIIAPPTAAQLEAAPARPGRKLSLLSIPNEGNIAALGLPPDCTYEEFRAADVANAGATPRSSAAIFEALVGLLAEKGISPEAARAAAGERYPQLFAELSHPAVETGKLGKQDQSAGGSLFNQVKALLVAKGVLSSDAGYDDILPALRRMNFAGSH